MMVSPSDDTAIMLADFGLGAFALPDQSMKLPCGTLTFTAPEVLIGKGYGMEVDLVGFASHAAATRADRRAMLAAPTLVGPRHRVLIYFCAPSLARSCYVRCHSGLLASSSSS